MDIPFGKILRPTPEEFADFAGYLDKLEKSNPFCGLFKIIPPKKWKPNNLNYETDIDNLVVSHPIEQNVYGKGGIYELLLIQKKSMRVKDYKKKIENFDHFTDNQPIENIEELFWRNIGFSPPLYGADIKGSLFDDNLPWDLKNLPGLLSDGLRKKISGVNEPYLYFGSWKTMFGWHKEDMDLYSINYLHHGKPKFWYCLPREEGIKLEKFAKQQFPEAFNKCKEYLRHKTIMISPYILKQKIPDLKVHKMIHYPGEFVITTGGSYHAGFNWGFNVAEAVNFALPKWLDILPTARSCQCMNDTVKIDQSEFLKNLAMTKKKYSIKNDDSEEDCDILKRVDKSSSSTKNLHIKPEIDLCSYYSSKKNSDSLKGNDNLNHGFKPSVDQAKKCDQELSKKQVSSNRKKGRAKKDDLDSKNLKTDARIANSSKKIKKSAQGFRGKSTLKNSTLDDKLIKKIKKIVNENDNQNISIENWLHCDESKSIRKAKEDKKMSIEIGENQNQSIMNNIPHWKLTLA